MNINNADSYFDLNKASILLVGGEPRSSEVGKKIPHELEMETKIYHF